MRSSKNREAILRFLSETDSHPTAEWVYEKVRADIPGISLGTVYRNLNQLREAGFVKTIGMVNGPEHFDAIVTPHPHVICGNCGSIMDLEKTKEMRKFMEEAGKASGFDVCEVQFLGICPKCRGIK